MRRAYLFLATAALLLATFASGELSQQFKDFPKGPAGLLMTKDEQKVYEKIATDAEAQAFIDLFWAKRNPNVDRLLNEFKQDFDARVQAADKNFSTEKVKGSVSDRGKTLILLGRPTGVSTIPAGKGTVESQTDSTARYTEDRGATQVWVYRKDRLPADVKVDEVLFVFVESRVGLNDFPFDRMDRRNVMGQKILAERPEKLIANPKLTEVPRPGLIAGTKAANAQQMAVLDAPAKSWPQGAVALAASGVQSEAVHPLWVYLQVPDSTAAATQAIGRVRKADGGAAGSFAGKVTAIPVAGARAYEFSLPLEAGAWKFDVALLDDKGAALATTTVDAANEPAPADSTYLGPVYWGVDVRQEATARVGDAFNVGGWHILPRVNDTYTNKESLAYFAYVVRPGLAAPAPAPAPAEGAQAPASAPAAQAPKVTVSLAVFQGDKKLTGSPTEEVNISKVGGEIYMYGSGLPLSVFRKGGDYRLEITLKDAIRNVERVAKIPLKIVIEGQAPAAPAAPPAPPAKP